MEPNEKVLEKVNHVDQEKSTSSINQDYYDEALNEPREEESLHRGLKARQISMIAVSVFLSAPSSYSQLCQAGRSCRDWVDHWLRNGSQTGWTSWCVLCWK